MIPKHIEKLVVEIAEKSGGERKKKIAEGNPEAVLASLLSTISERVTNASKTVDNAVEYSLFKSNLAEIEQRFRDEMNIESGKIAR